MSSPQWRIQDIPEAGTNPRGGRKPIIWHNFGQRLHENGKKLDWHLDHATVYLCMPLLQEQQRLSWYSTWSPRRTSSFTVPRPMQRSQVLVPVPAHLSHDWLPDPLHWWHICGIEEVRDDGATVCTRNVVQLLNSYELYKTAINMQKFC